MNCIPLPPTTEEKTTVPGVIRLNGSHLLLVSFPVLCMPLRVTITQLIKWCCGLRCIMIRYKTLTEISTDDTWFFTHTNHMPHILQVWMDYRQTYSMCYSFLIPLTFTEVTESVHPLFCSVLGSMSWVPHYNVCAALEECCHDNQNCYVWLDSDIVDQKNWLHVCSLLLTTWTWYWKTQLAHLVPWFYSKIHFLLSAHTL